MSRRAISSERSRYTDCPEPIAPAETLHPREACDEVPGCRQWRTLKARPDTCSINKIDLRILPELQLVEASDLLQEIERPVIAAHKKMLAVVHLTTRGSIGKGIGTPAKETSGFEQQDLSSLRAEFYG